MKHKKKLWISLAFIALAGMLYRLSLVLVRETAGVVLILASVACVIVALTVFALYFRER